jgi:hypothetical protein
MKKTDKAFEFDYESVKNKALAQLKSGKPLLGKEGALGPSFKSFLEAALEAERRIICKTIVKKNPTAVMDTELNF